MNRLLPLLAAAVFAAQPGYKAEVERWRQDRESRLKADDGWLTLTGLFWLKEGENRAGSAPGSRVELPSDFPAHAGTFRVNGSLVTFERDGHKLVLKTDKHDKPDIVPIGRLNLHVIERGSKFGVRVKDPESEYRRKFTRLSWFPVNSEWLIRARFVPQPRRMVFDAEAGDKQEMQSPGYVEWTWRGQKLRLTPVTEGDQLFFIFRDKTAGKSTYPAARFLYADPPKNGIVIVDFNKAYNPPCVFTPYATCPLPPPENRLAVPVEAGERMYTGH
jgi:hypothetical protein